MTIISYDQISQLSPAAKADPEISEKILGKGRTWQVGVRTKSLYKAVLRVRGDPAKVAALRAKGILSELSAEKCDKVIDSALSKIAEQVALTFFDTDGATLASALTSLGWMVVGDLRGSSGFFIPVDTLGRDHAVNNLAAYQLIDDINSNRSRDRIRATFLKENGRGPSPLAVQRLRLARGLVGGQGKDHGGPLRRMAADQACMGRHKAHRNVSRGLFRCRQYASEQLGQRSTGARRGRPHVLAGVQIGRERDFGRKPEHR